MENPQSPEFDVGKNAFNIVTIRRAFEHGYHVLVAALSAPAERFPSILGVVVQVVLGHCWCCYFTVDTYQRPLKHGNQIIYT